MAGQTAWPAPFAIPVDKTLPANDLPVMSPNRQLGYSVPRVPGVVANFRLPIGEARRANIWVLLTGSGRRGPGGTRSTIDAGPRWRRG
ncbi:MAG: hypothetical protein JWQ87_3546 [Candidatus Sulfotelmatobacter sp.]|nr:hypothetical protein [Candidatus Sulfotelmatobacter sp.]